MCYWQISGLSAGCVIWRNPLDSTPCPEYLKICHYELRTVHSTDEKYIRLLKIIELVKVRVKDSGGLAYSLSNPAETLHVVSYDTPKHIVQV